MAPSFTERPPLQCPQCGASFTPEIWLIIDAAERPDLIDRAKDGSIHDVYCPNGHAAALDAPLLLYRPGETWPLIFSPAQQTTRENDQEIAGGLMERLAESLGDIWDDAWLESIIEAPRPLLAAALSDILVAAVEAMSEVVPSEVAAALDEMAAESAKEGVTLESPEDLARAVEARPELRDRLLAMAGENEDGDTSGDARQAQVPLGARQAFEEVIAAVADEGMSVNSPEGLQAALATRPELQSHLNAALDEAMAETVPAEVAAVLAEIAAALEADGVALESPDDLERALDAQPGLRARLEAAVAAAGKNEDDDKNGADGEGSPPALLQAWIATPSWTESCRFLLAHPDLLGEQAEAALAGLLEQATAAGNTNAMQAFREHLTLLKCSREVGAQSAYAEKLDVAPEQFEQAVQSAEAEAQLPLDAKGLSVDSPEELQAALAPQWELQERLEAVLGGGTDVPDDIREILNQLAGLNRLQDMPRRVSLLREALRRLPVDAAPEIRAALRNGLGNALAQNPLGERAANLEGAITAYSAALQVRTREAFPEQWAMTQNNLGNAFSDRIRGERATNLEEAIAAYSAALQVYTREAFPIDWAMTQNNLGNAYADRIRGERATNLEAAIAAYRAALEVYTREALPANWAGTQNNLGTVYRERIRGNRAENLEAAILAYRDALGVYTLEAFPEDWAMTQDNLGTVYRERIRGERWENLEESIASYRAALEVRERKALPVDWAGTQNNLGNAYRERIRGDRAENLEDAIAAYRAALQVRTREAFPEQWAATQNNLSNAYLNRIRGERAANLEEAIAACRAALEVRTPEALPGDWAMSQNNLGNAYRYRIRGERLENLEAALAAYRSALEVYTREMFPVDWAMVQNNLGNAYRERIRGDRAENLEAAIAACRAALEVRTREELPVDWAMTQNNLGNAFLERVRGDRAENLEAAIAAYHAALQVYTRESFPVDWAMVQNNLGNAYRDRIRGERLENLEAALAAYRSALEVYTREMFPVDWAMVQNNLGIVYRERIQGDRAENLETAISACRAALEVRTREKLPVDWAMTQNNLGNAFLERVRGDRAENLEAAIVAYCVALQVYTREAFPIDWAIVQNDLGNAYADRVRGDRAENLEAAIAAYHAALKGINEAFLAVSASAVISEQSRWADLYARTVRLLLDTDRVGEALAVAEGSKSRLLSLLMSRGDIAAPQGVPEELLAEEERRAAELNAIDTASLAEHSRSDVSPAEQLRERVVMRETSLAALLTVWAQIEVLGPEAAEYVALRRGDRPSWETLSRLAGSLGSGVALLSLFDTGDQTLVFLLRGDTAEPVVQSMDLSDSEAGLFHNEMLYLAYIASYQDEMLNRAVLRELGRPPNHHWRALGRPLLGPLRPHLAGIDQLIIAPAGVYHQLPLHVLWLSEDGDTLLDHCAVSYVPALSVLERLWRRAPLGEGRAAVLGYTHANPETERGRVERAIFFGEAVDVAAQLGVEPALDAAVTGATLRAVTADPLHLLHLSCHGYFHPTDALASGVLLAGENGGAAVYTARQFLEQRLPVELVTLSACQTGISGSLGGDEMAGLSMALLSAGARSLLLGLWSVESMTTAALMRDFYRRLWPDNGDASPAKAEALRQTVLALQRGELDDEIKALFENVLDHIIPETRDRFRDYLKQLDSADPYYWASFALIGDWR